MRLESDMKHLGPVFVPTKVASDWSTMREAASEVIAGPAVEPHPLTILAGDDSESIVLNLMQPLAAGRQLIGFGWKARRDEPGRKSTLQHADLK
jgi:hypothetical protein